MNKSNARKQQRSLLTQSQQWRDEDTATPYVPAGSRRWVQQVARGMAALLLCQGTLFALPGYAQVAPSANAPAGQRAIMDAAQNGVPIAHIRSEERRVGKECRL